MHAVCTHCKASLKAIVVLLAEPWHCMSCARHRDRVEFCTMHLVWPCTSYIQCCPIYGGFFTPLTRVDVQQLPSFSVSLRPLAFCWFVLAGRAMSLQLKAVVVNAVVTAALIGCISAMTKYLVPNRKHNASDAPLPLARYVNAVEVQGGKRLLFISGYLLIL